MIIEYFLKGLTAFATIIIAYAAFRQLRESAEERRRSTRLKVLGFLYHYQDLIEAAIRLIPEKKFTDWNIEKDIRNWTLEFYHLHKNFRTELRRVSIEYNKLREEQNLQKVKTPEKMEKSLKNLEKMIEKEIDFQTSKLQLNQV